MEPNLGTKGATRQSWGRDNIRQIFREIQAENPSAGAERLARLLSERMEEDSDARLAGASYIVDNLLNSQKAYERREEPTRPERKAPTPEETAARKKQTEETVESIKSQILLLNMEMPNGKRMRHCTREEMQGFRSGYGRIIKKMKPGQTVGQVFDEASIRTAMDDE
jgi:hypothetical protein